MADKNIAEITVKVTTQGQADAQEMTNQLKQISQVATNVAAGLALMWPGTSCSTRRLIRTCVSLPTRLSAGARCSATGPSASNTGVAQAETQFQALSQSWGSLQKQVDEFETTTMKQFASTSTKIFTDWITHTGNARQAFRQFLMEVIKGLIQMAIQYILSKVMMSQADKQASTQSQQQSAQTMAMSIPAYLAKAGEQGGWVGVLIAVVVMLAALAALTAVAG